MDGDASIAVHVFHKKSPATLGYHLSRVRFVAVVYV